MYRKVLIGIFASLFLTLLILHVFGGKIFEFYRFNEATKSLLEKAQTVKKQDRKIINLADIERFDSSNDGFIGMVIEGEKYHIQKTRSMRDFRKITDSDEVYLYNDDTTDPEFKGLVSLCFVNENEKVACLLAVHVKTSLNEIGTI
ncbi:hypothetical protein [Rheinheimera sp.]|uniref:hypothetical protein n=1 Tax=Rheinheimera sp. TaxID=1869214 RepID=UPI004047D331